MLKASQISSINMLQDGEFSEAWRTARISKITSSNAWKLMSIRDWEGKKKWGETAMGYIRTRVFEKISKVTSDKEISTQDTINGLVEEGHSLRIFKQNKGIDNFFFKVQKLINGLEPDTSSTPDAIWIKSAIERDGENQYDACTIESKSYSANKHVMCVECTTPAEIKEVDFPAYCQVLDQLIVCGCLTGYLLYFHPSMPQDKGGYREIEFKQIDPGIRADIKILKDRKLKAQQEIDRIYKKLTNQSI